MNLSSHVVVWVTATLVVGLAAPLARAYTTYLEHRARARTDALVARLASGVAGAPRVRDDARSSPVAET